MKRFIYIIMIYCLVFVGLFCRPVKSQALVSELNGLITTISDRDQNRYNIVFVFDVANKDVQTDLGIIFFYTTTPQSYNYSMYLDISNNNELRIRDRGGNVLETDNLSTRLLQVQIVEDLSHLYLVVYCLNYTYQVNQGNTPIIDGVSRTMITRYQLPSNFLTTWESGDLYISTTATFNYAGIPNYLMNYSYITSSETPQDINNWVDALISNYGIYNNMLDIGYYYGNQDGYSDGFDDGEDRGYSDGYSAGVSDGHDDGYNEGYVEGFDDGESAGYDAGYTDGEAGNNAVHPLWAMIRDIAVGIGDILAIQLGPGITIGTIVFVPLFFSALGLILWIWRRN